MKKTILTLTFLTCTILTARPEFDDFKRPYSAAKSTNKGSAYRQDSTRSYTPKETLIGYWSFEKKHNRWVFYACQKKCCKNATVVLTFDKMSDREIKMVRWEK